MECLDAEILCMHLDNELEPQRHADVAAHLRTCQRCMDRLRTLREHDAGLRSLFPSPRTSDATGRACYSAEELSAYASGLLTSQEEARFEQHLQTCDVCLREVMAIHDMLTLLRRERLITPPASLVAAVQQDLASAKPAKSVVEQLGVLVLQVAQDGLRFVEALLLPEHVRLAVGGHSVPAGAFRSLQGSTEATSLLDIQQSVRDFDLRISVLQEDAATVLLKIRISRQGTPMTRKRVSLFMHGRVRHSRNTSVLGEVEFPRLALGEYTIRIPQGNVETQLVLRPREGTTHMG